jgi:hypothetical protein
VSSPVGYRWFRHAGGVNPCLPPTVSGRYLSFSEREDMALLRTQSQRRPRTWRLDYKATIAQWHAEPRARWPKVAKLAESERLRTWVQDRLAGEVKLPDGTTVGPKPKAGTARTPNLAFDFDDALLQLDDALLQLADPGLELLDELTECAILGLKVDVARCAG